MEIRFLVFDKVYGGKLLASGMTLLNVGNEFPNHLIFVRIKLEDRAKFNYKPEEQFKGKCVIISGKLVVDYNGKPEIEIIVTDPAQITETYIFDPKLHLKKQ